MGKKKIVLYNPRSLFYDMPLALLQVGSALDSNKFDVRIIDARVEKKPHRLLLNECRNALCLGITVLTGLPIRDAIIASRLVKNNYPGISVVWGGWHPSLFATEILENESSVDITVQSQGEETFRELAECLASGSPADEIKGLTLRLGNGAIKKNPPRELKDINDFPAVNYNLIDNEKYFKLKKKRQFDYITSTGCRFRCTFCADPFVYGRSWVAYTPERIADELKYWKNKIGFSDVNFQDETFFTKRKRVSEIAESFITNNLEISWAATMRADQGDRLSDEEFQKCKNSGLRRVLVGVESGSQKMMNWLKKDIKKEQVISTALKCIKYNVSATFPFIVGFPGETSESLIATLEFSRQLNSMHPNFHTPIFYFKPYPGSEITNQIKSGGYRLPKILDEWAEFDFSASGPWVSREKYKLVERFKFYNKLAYRKNGIILKPFEYLAAIRMNQLNFKFPFEKKLADIFFPAKQLS